MKSILSISIFFVFCLGEHLAMRSMSTSRVDIQWAIDEAKSEILFHKRLSKLSNWKSGPEGNDEAIEACTLVYSALIAHLQLTSNFSEALGIEKQCNLKYKEKRRITWHYLPHSLLIPSPSVELIYCFCRSDKERPQNLILAKENAPYTYFQMYNNPNPVDVHPPPSRYLHFVKRAWKFTTTSDRVMISINLSDIVEQHD